MEKTFKEIIENIKDGEVWENNSQRVARIYLNKSGNLQLEGNDNGFAQNFSTCVGLNITYKLKKGCPFHEAFKAYEEGKEIESYKYRYKKIDGRDCFYSTLSKEWQGDRLDFTLDEIRNDWYIKE